MKVFIHLWITLNCGLNGAIWRNSDPVVFVEDGAKCTFFSQIEDGNAKFIMWYKQSPNGVVKSVTYVSSFQTNTQRYQVMAPDSSGQVTLTVLAATREDTGLYFAVTRHGPDKMRFKFGTATVLIVTETGLPLISVYRYGPGRKLLCEVSGAGPGWSEPFWVEADNQKKVSETLKSLDTDGTFVQSSILDISVDEKVATCMSRQNSTGAVIQANASLTEGVTPCEMILYVIPALCGLLLFVTVVTTLWAIVLVKKKKHRTAYRPGHSGKNGDSTAHHLNN